ncbi:MAG: bifunctional [glutamate--ammonia ligase]-adenylyl-L-tyrosine phosphorylase/[glutamate--ammonia-ligase] adenylyltransferase [Pseudomonadota bacterium]
MSSSEAPADAGPIRPLAEWPAALTTESAYRWEAVCAAAAGAGLPLPPNAIAPSAGRVMTLSDFVYRSLFRTPSLLTDLATPGYLDNARPPDYYSRAVAAAVAACPDEATLMQALRRIRQREMIRIAYRDLAAKASLEDTVAELSAFADACIQQTLAVLHQWLAGRHGEPRDSAGSRQQLVIIAMGKLGAGELNFSSDIDIIFAFPEPGETDGGAPISCEEFFTRLSRQLIRVIGATTADGFVFRVDARLRPHGDNGPMVMSFDAMEDYYQSQGREWERYAWIKARMITGRPLQADDLAQRLKPFVYRRYLDYGAIDSLREMKAMISLEVKKKGMRHHVKLGAGGIREIEFFGQIFQLMRGGVAPALQARPIQHILRQLAALECIPGPVAHELTAAYRFLRNTEHRLQMAGDQQIHTLPEDDTPRLKLAVAMGFSSWKAFEDILSVHQDRVHGHFRQLLAPDSPTSHTDASRDKNARLGAVWKTVSADDDNRRILSEAGFTSPEDIIQRLAHHRTDPRTRALSREGRARLDRLIPRILESAVENSRPDVALGRIIDLLGAIQQRTNYLSLLNENPPALAHLTRLAGISPWIMAFLSQHPVLLDELLDPRTLYTPPQRHEISLEIDRRLADIDPDDLESQIEALCIFKNVNTLRVAAADITGALPLMRTSDHLTDIAEVVVENVLSLSWRHMVQKHGTPSASVDGRPVATGFAVISYGKLGGIELGYGADLDMVFLHAADSGNSHGSARSLDNAQFYARLGQRMIHILTTHTRAGRLYEVDMRLRPSGSGGILVSHIDAYADYLSTEAWTWEHQALVRARPIAGDPEMVTRFTQIRHAIIARSRDPETLRREVVQMREKMRSASFTPQPDRFHIKQGSGGIVDIEFLVQYLVLRHACRHPELTRWSDNVRQMEALITTSVLPLDTAGLLKQAFLSYRSAVHRLNLEERPGDVPVSRFREISSQVSRIWRQVMIDGPA